jgi:hypothetical protein
MQSPPIPNHTWLLVCSSCCYLVSATC